MPGPPVSVVRAQAQAAKKPAPKPQKPLPPVKTDKYGFAASPLPPLKTPAQAKPKPKPPAPTVRQALASSPVVYKKGQPALSGQVRVDPGGGLVAYGGRNKQEFLKTAAQQRRQAALAKRQELAQRKAAAQNTLKKQALSRARAQVRAAGFAPGADFGSRLASDIQATATGFPSGLYQFGKAVAQDLNPAHPVSGHTLGFVENIGRAYAHNYRHPLRYISQHPGFAALDVGAALSAGAGAASRVAAAGDAARVGGLRAALTRPAAEGGSLLKRPLPSTRIHYYEGQPIRGRHSTNPAVEQVQKALDRRALAKATQRVVKGEAPTISTIKAPKAARLLDEQRRVVDAAEKSPILKVAAHAKHLKENVGANLAADVIGVGLPVDEHVRLLRKAAAEASGKTRQRLARRAQLIDQQARRYIDESSGAPQPTPELAPVVSDIKKATTKTEEDLHRAGLLSRSGAETRRQAAGRVLLGAKFVPKSLEEAGTSPHNLIGKRVVSKDGVRGAVVDVSGDTASVRLWRKGNAVVDVPLHELYPASGKVKEGRLVGGGRAVSYERALTKEEAQARLAKLEGDVGHVENAIAKQLQQAEPQKYPQRGKPLGQGTGGKAKERQVRPDQMRYQRYGANRGKVDLNKLPAGDYVEATNRVYKAGKTGKELALEEAQRILAERAAKPGAHPVYKRYAAAAEERDVLRAALNAHGEAPIFGHSPLRSAYEALAQRHNFPGNIIDTDHVRRLIPGYAGASADERAALAAKYQKAASAGSDQLYAEMLKDPPKTGIVDIMAGGSGAGKSTVGIDPMGADVVLDTTLSRMSTAVPKIEKALNSGRSVNIVYVYRDPAEAYARGVLNDGRLSKDGRVVPIAEHVRMHVDSNATIRELGKKYAGNERVKIRVVDNSKPGHPEIPLSRLPKLKYDAVEREVRKAYEAEAGRLTEAQRTAALAGGARSVPGALGRPNEAGAGGVGAGGSGNGGAGASAGVDFPLFGTATEHAGSAPYTGGQFYTPESRISKLPGGPMAFRGGIPRKPGSLTNAYKGALRMTGRNTHEVLRAITENLLSKQRYLSAERLRQRILPMGRDVKPADTRTVKWAPVRVHALTDAARAELRHALSNIDELTPDEASRIDAALANVQESLFPERQYATVPAGTHVPGIVWVDRRLLGSQHKLIGSLGPIDLISDATKGLILYAKPGYVAPNVLGNVAYNLIHQGFLAPANWTRAVRMNDHLGFLIDEVVGSGVSRALSEGNVSAITGAVHAAGNFWSRFVDGPFRRASFIHEAGRYGFRTDAQILDLIENPANRDLYAEVAQRARDAIVEYERMGPAERDVIRRLIFVYPWVKGSTYYAGQFLRDHPVQAAVFADLAQQGNAQNRRDLGPVPAWAAGSFKVFQHGNTPYVINPQSISPFSTPAQVLEAAQGGFQTMERSQLLGEMVNPAAQAAIEAAFGRDLFTGRELKGGYAQNFVGQLGKGLPAYQLINRERNPNPKATYPYGRLGAAGQFILGGASPRPANVQRLNDLAATRSPTELAKRRAAKEEQAVFSGLTQKAPKLLQGSTLRARLKSAYERKVAVDTMRARVKHDVGTGEPYDRAVLLEELKLLRSWGLVGDNAAKRIRQAAATGSDADVKEWRSVLRSQGFSEAYLGLIGEAKQEAGVK